MTLAEAIEAFDQEFPKPSDNLIKITSNASQKKYSQKEALKILISTPELLQPLPFLLFSHDTILADIISYKEYAVIMKQKALKSKNQALLNLANAALALSN